MSTAEASRAKDIRDLRRLVAKLGLASAGTACEILSIQRSGLPPLRRRDPNFPAELEQLPNGPVFIKAEIEDYASQRRTRGRDE